MKRETVLLISSDRKMIDLCRAIFVKEGFLFQRVSGNDDDLNVLAEDFTGIVLIDTSVLNTVYPGILRYISESLKTPVVVIGRESTTGEKVRFLNSGADSYIGQPENPDELIAEVKALLRKTERVVYHPDILEFASGDMEFIHTHRLVTVRGKEINLTPLEYGLLRELMLNAGKTLSYNHLLQKIWGPEYTEKQYLYLYISYLRKKIEADPRNPRIIITVTRVGYLFNTENNDVKE